jgi:hypothetical protein
LARETIRNLEHDLGIEDVGAKKITADKVTTSMESKTNPGDEVYVMDVVEKLKIEISGITI